MTEDQAPVVVRGCAPVPGSVFCITVEDLSVRSDQWVVDVARHRRVSRCEMCAVLARTRRRVCWTRP
jgi:hypothetical protein